MNNEQATIEARRAPIQKRSIERVNRILDVTAEMLQEVGVDGVKTTEIARRADIKLASLYRYFPNKNAILKSLAERQFEKLAPSMASFLEDFNLEEGLDQLIDVYVEFYRNEPGYTELWSGIQGVPELNQLDMDDLYKNARMIVVQLHQKVPHIPEQELMAVALMVTRSCGAILRLAMTTDEATTQRLVAEVKLMVKQYLRARLGLVA